MTAAAKIGEWEEKRRARGDILAANEELRDLTSRCCICGSSRIGHGWTQGQIPPINLEPASKWLGLEGEPLGRVTVARCTECMKLQPRDHYGNLDEYVLYHRLKALGLFDYMRGDSDECLGPLSWASWALSARFSGAPDPGNGEPFDYLIDAVPDPRNLDWTPHR